ncbi:MAG: AAA family ATPase [Brevinematia bacterium]
MIFNKGLERVILSAVEGKHSGGVVFVGPRGLFKTFSSEVIISKFLEDYRSCLPFNHSDIFVAGPYYYVLSYKFFRKNVDKLKSNERLRELFFKFVGFCIANRGLGEDIGDLSELFSLVTALRQQNFDIKALEKLLLGFESIISSLSRMESIGIDTVREVIHFVNRTSLSGYKFVLLSEFDKATTEAQNALLKTLEEPPKGVFFILTTSRYEKILATIRSRVVKISFFKFKGDEIREFFQGIAELDSNGYYSFYDLMLEDVYRVSTEFFGKFLKVLVSGNLEVAMDLVDEIVQEDILVEKFFEVASRVINLILEARARNLGFRIATEREVISVLPREFLQKFTISRLSKLQTLLDDGYTKVYSFNINPKFVLTDFFMEIFSYEAFGT